MNRAIARVFVCQESMRKNPETGRLERRDLSPAKKFGELIFILNWSDTKVINSSSDELVWKIRRALIDFCEHDYIVPIGDPTVIQLVGIIAAEMSGGRYKVLQWDSRARRYEVIQNDLNCQPPREMAAQ